MLDFATALLDCMALAAWWRCCRRRRCAGSLSAEPRLLGPSPPPAQVDAHRPSTPTSQPSPTSIALKCLHSHHRGIFLSLFCIFSLFRSLSPTALWGRIDPLQVHLAPDPSTRSPGGIEPMH
ncbi:hypothetical protein BU26DRAFT_144372 [Trematosphaeria pertusa]|uniref:Uncharacterized protein n=1 Tax=Trematosphaeria pertusa TaxID=390896 RepID=A0A6A6J002_9PLEO|nr:uncharacterized protein BU26DRAFT_144372 [Trematosphaeria pertusa]KAF2254733.1 hypothetical protein BU26DRAFT_144372 [Trematosphaeria pertusa]